MFKSVQTAVTSVSFPKTLEELRKMGTKWLGMVGRDWITELDVLLPFPSSGVVTWIALKWLTAGDLLFFYHTKSARKLIRDLLTEAYQIQRQSHTMATAYTTDEIERLVAILERIDSPSRKVGGYSCISLAE